MRDRLTVVAALLIACTACGGAGEQPAEPDSIRVERLLDAPIISPSTDPSIGENIQGPSLIRVPDWVENPLGRYYLYFADHKGSYIRLAYADDLLGPWSVHEPGSLQIENSHFPSENLQVPEERMEELQPRVDAALEQRRATYGNNVLPHSILLEFTAVHIASPDVHVDDENQRIVMYFHGLEDVGRTAGHPGSYLAERNRV